MRKNTVYFQDGKLRAESGQVRAYEFHNEFYLDYGNSHNLIDKDEYVVDYMWQIRDKPFGKCLVLGLGLGRVVEYILSVPKVASVVVVEPNSDVIKVQNKIKSLKDDNISVINEDILSYLYSTEHKFDFIFLKCYSNVDRTTLSLIADVVRAAKRVKTFNGSIIGWLGNDTEEELVSSFFDLFK